MSNFVLISGCSGGGKSTLLHEFKQRGFPTVSEPGRRIVQEEQAQNGQALPWINLELFAERALQLAREDMAEITQSTTDRSKFVFFDRGYIDAAVAYEKASGVCFKRMLAGYPAYYKSVFLAPPWPEIFVTDKERPHGFAEAEEEYKRLYSAIAALGYNILLLPKIDVAKRVDYVLEYLKAPF